jgi:hypothetical protein
MPGKFKEGDGLHDLASTGKNCRVTRKGRVLTAEGWRLHFQELYQEASNLLRALRVTNSAFLASGSP